MLMEGNGNSNSSTMSATNGNDSCSNGSTGARATRTAKRDAVNQMSVDDSTTSESDMEIDGGPTTRKYCPCLPHLYHQRKLSPLKQIRLGPHYLATESNLPEVQMCRRILLFIVTRNSPRCLEWNSA